MVSYLASRWLQDDVCKYDLIIDSYRSFQKALEVSKKHFGGPGQLNLRETLFSLQICSASEIGGLSPSTTLLQEVICHEDFFYDTRTKFRVLIRPRPGNFEYGPRDISMIMDDIRWVMEWCEGFPHFEGLVLGGTREGKLDVSLIISAISLARTYRPCKFTINSAIDLTTEPVDDLIKKLCELAPFDCDVCLTGGRFRGQGSVRLLDLRALYMGLYGKMKIILTRPLSVHQFRAFYYDYKIPITLIQISAKKKRGKKPREEKFEDELSRCFGVCDDLDADTLMELVAAEREIRKTASHMRDLKLEFFEDFDASRLEGVFEDDLSDY